MLSEEQQRLLHAWVDGECTEAEAEIAVDLLSQPEASEYVSELKRLRELVAKHAGIYAPAGLLERVRDALRREARQKNVLQLFAWRAVGLAAAAAVVIAAGIVLSPMLNEPEPAEHVAIHPVLSSETNVKEAADEAADTVEDSADDLGGKVGAGLPASRPAPPADEARATGGEDGRTADKKMSNVLRLDRGVHQPLEISVQMNRGNAARNLQVYNDLLMISSLYGDAELKDGAVSESLTGRDFSEFDGVSVEVEQDRLPELIAALNRLAADQAYGEVVVPHDLRESIASTASDVTELQGISRQQDEKVVEEARRDWGARTYLPSDVQRECLKSELKDRPEALKRLNTLKRQNAGNSVQTGKAKPEPEKRKVQLLLRLR